MSGLIVLFRTTDVKRSIMKKADYRIWDTLLSVRVKRPELSELFQLGGYNKLSVVPRKILKNPFEAFRHIGEGYTLSHDDLAGKDVSSSLAESVRLWVKANLDNSDNWAVVYFPPEKVEKFQLVQKLAKG